MKAQTGEIVGLLFAAQQGHDDHLIGMVGSYECSPMVVLSCGARMMRFANRQLDKSARAGGME